MKYIALAILGLVSSQSLQASDNALPSESNGGRSILQQVVRTSVPVATAPLQSVMDGGSNTMSFFARMIFRYLAKPSTRAKPNNIAKPTFIR